MGVLLSGGVDSSLVSLASADWLNSQVQTFTATFRGTSFDEARYASKVALRAGSKHTEVDVPMDGVPSKLSRLVETFGEPFGDMSAIPTFSLFQGIKPYVKVVLTGDGGDETFAGYKDVKVFLIRSALSRYLGASDILGMGFLEALTKSHWRKGREFGYGLIALRRDGGEVFNSLHREGWTRSWRRQFMRPESWRWPGGEVTSRQVV